MANEKIKYSNGCSPQELDSISARWYQDSDVGTKLSGSANVSMGSGTLTYQSEKTITSRTASKFCARIRSQRKHIFQIIQIIGG